ncbi:MAG: fumarylacetoacetate hydrolase family protein [Pontiellaceae bacterium]|nr:fumarylacetoacetate hydrolase family protein [Pontiellaceae bacterium]
MKLVRFGEKGLECPGVWMGDGRILDVRASAFHLQDFDAHFFSGFGMHMLRQLIADPGAVYVDSSAVRLGPPITIPSKIICVGANYAAHAKEFGHDVPSEPILFSKAISAIVGPNDEIVLPAEAQVVDSEAELAVVISREAKSVSRQRAMDYVAGYTVLNDVTERIVQRAGSQWFRGKGFDTFCPIGPFLVTPDEVDNVDNLRVWQKYNGTILQDGCTSDLLFSIPFLIEYISRGMTLLPGDVISTGTPPGIGSARDPKVLMRAGDVIEVGVDGLGSQRSVVQECESLHVEC